MRYLVVGDLHAQIGNLEDTETILKELVRLSKEVDAVVFLGDIYHTHSVIRQEIVSLLKKYMKEIRGRNQSRPYVLVGNHDYVGPTNTSMNAVSLTLEDYVVVVDEPHVFGNVLFVPFMPDNEKFVQACIAHPEAKTLFCHQTFDTAQYENGFYAPGGVDQNKVLQRFIVAGHIHKRQRIGKVFYVGTPRALTSSDANDYKGVHILDVNDAGDSEIVDFICFNDKVKSYRKIHITEGDVENSYSWEALCDLKSNQDVSLSIHGSLDFCKETQAQLAEMNLVGRVRVVLDVKKTEQKQLSIESAGMTVEDALKKYVFEIAEVDSKLKDGVWETIQKAMI